MKYQVDKTKLTDNTTNDYNPYLAKDGDISWQSAAGKEDTNVWYYDYSEESGYSEDKSVAIGKSPVLETNPYTYYQPGETPLEEGKTAVAYELNYEDGNSDIQYWNSELPSKKITDTPHKESNPETWGDYVVYDYQETGSEQRDIYLYNVTDETTTPIANELNDEYNHHIVGDYVVYESKSGENSNLYSYDITTGETSEIGVSENNETNADVWGNGNVVYEYETANGYKDIYYYDNLTGETKTLADSQWDESAPDIAGNYVTWQGWDGNDYEIYRYDIANDSVDKLTDNTVNDYAPHVSTEGYVTYQQNPTAENADLYVHTGTENISLGTSEYVEANAQIYGNYVTWQAWDGNDWEVYSAEITPETAPAI